MIGHLILRRSIEEEDILGLKVTGGHPLPSGKIGAIIEKVKRGSIADREGHVKPGNPVRIQNQKKNITMRPANGHETIANHTFLLMPPQTIPPPFPSTNNNIQQQNKINRQF